MSVENVQQMKPEIPRLYWFHTFLCVDMYGGYSGAAIYLGCNQSAVSRQIASLEEWLGEALFTKNIPPQLTEYGKIFRPKCKEFLKMIYKSRGPKFNKSSPHDTTEENKYDKMVGHTLAGIYRLIQLPDGSWRAPSGDRYVRDAETGEVNLVQRAPDARRTSAACSDGGRSSPPAHE